MAPLALLLPLLAPLCQGQVIPNLPSPRVVLVGPTGSGKSSMALALLGCDPMAPPDEVCMFEVCDGLGSCTKQTTYGFGPWLGTGPTFTVVDTPGFGDSDGEDETLMEEMMQVLADVIEKADTIVLLLKGDETRFNEGLQTMIKKLSVMFGSGWWDYLVIGVSFWPYDQDSIDARNTTCQNYPSKCKDEAWFADQITSQIMEKFGVDKKIPFVFTDAWSQTIGHTEDETEQEHWVEETGKLWEVTASREEPFDFMTIDDILEDNAAMRAEIKWLNDIITQNISQLNELIGSVSNKVDTNESNITTVSNTVNTNSGNILDNKDLLEILQRDVVNNEADIKIWALRVEENKGNMGLLNQSITQNSASISSTNERVDVNIRDISSTNDRVDVNIRDISTMQGSISAMKEQSGFSVYGLTTGGHSGVIKFSSVLYDPTSSYSPSTGEYTVPVAGTYMFTYTLYHASGDPMYSYLRVGGERVGGMASAPTGQSDMVTGSALVDVERGEKITLYVSGGQAYDNSNARNMFSGMRVFLA